MSDERRERFILAPYVAVGFQRGTLRLGYGSLGQTVDDPLLQNAVLELCAFLKEPRSESEIHQFVSQAPVYKVALSLLEAKPYLISTKALDEIPRSFHRTALALLSRGLDPSATLRKLDSAKVVILGCGAIGTSLALGLATLGVKNFTLIDPDQFDDSNWGRSKHLTKDSVGQPKVEYLRELILEKESAATIAIHNLEISQQDAFQLPKGDFVFLSADSGHLRTWLREKCEIPWMQVGYAHDFAVWGPLVLPKSSPVPKPAARSVAEGRLLQMGQTINQGYIAPAPFYIAEVAVSFAIQDFLMWIADGPVRCSNKQVAIPIENPLVIEG